MIVRLYRPSEPDQLVIGYDGNVYHADGTVELGRYKPQQQRRAPELQRLIAQLERATGWTRGDKS